MIERGLVDVERIGVVRCSNGGILPLGLITRNASRYKAAASAAADWEWSADTAVTRFGLALNDCSFGDAALDMLDREVVLGCHCRFHVEWRFHRLIGFSSKSC